MPTLKEDSGLQWDSHSTLEEIKVGSLQRIADATELMAKSYIQLQSEYNWMRQSRDAWQKSHQILSRQNAALKGVITKFKKLR